MLLTITFSLEIPKTIHIPFQNKHGIAQTTN